MSIQESGEMYLEAILRLGENGRDVRSVDIADYMNFSKPSVSRAVGVLKHDGYITVDGKGYITFTETGRKTAEKSTKGTECLRKYSYHLGLTRRRRQRMPADWSMI